MVKLYLAPQFSKAPPVRIVRSHPSYRSTSSDNSLLFKGTPQEFEYTDFDFTTDIVEADFVLVPQAIRKMNDNIARYLDETKAFARTHGKEVVVIIGTDLSYKIHIPGVIAFKASEYKSTQWNNEIIAPGYAADLSKEIPITWREKGSKPVVSFCGYAGFPSLSVQIRYVIKNILLDLLSYVTGNPDVRARKRGIYFRRKALGLLERDMRIATSFIKRDSFSGNRSSIALDPNVARKEYLENMRDSDFVLAPKGDGNYSVRFFEALSLGRIPLLVDTDCPLPLEGVLDYSKFMLRAPHTKLGDIGTIVSQFYAGLSNDEYLRMQREARRVFEQYVQYDRFFNRAFRMLKEGGIEAFKRGDGSVVQ